MRKIMLSVINPSLCGRHQSIESTATIPKSRPPKWALKLLLPFLFLFLSLLLLSLMAIVEARQPQTGSYGSHLHRRQLKANHGENHLQQASTDDNNKQANRSMVLGNPNPNPNPSLNPTTQSDSVSGSQKVRCEEQHQQHQDSLTSAGAILSPESIQIAELLARYYRVPTSSLPSPSPPPPKAPSLPQQRQQTVQQTSAKQHQGDGDGGSPTTTTTPNGAQRQDFRPELPRPLNVTVLIISWSPPILKLQWKLNELDESDASRLDFYHQLNGHHHQQPLALGEGHGNNNTAAPVRPLLDQFDLELSITEQQPLANGSRKSQHDPSRLDSGIGFHNDNNTNTNNDYSPAMEEELRIRRVLLDKSLSCFQVTYNIINSRFKVTEEYPPYLRSIMLERLLPATEYSLRVGAVYLGGRYRTLSDRVQFISPTDNESRRFKENTYRPIHRYPDERRELRIGLAQVRSEELTIVIIAVVFWIATICLFFNKWGKIRMLEPYQPAYREISPTASFVAAHHHPSLHNLPNSATGGTGSCGGGGMGSGPLAAAAVAANLVAAAAGGAAAAANPKVGAAVGGTSGSEVAAGIAASDGTNSLVATAATTINGTLLHHGTTGTTPTPSDITAQPSLEGAGPLPGVPSGLSKAHPAPTQRGSDGAVASGAGRGGANRGLLLLGHKRFESLAGVGGAGGGGAGDIASTLRRTDTELNYLFQSKALALAKATSLWSKQQQKLRQLQYRAHLPGSFQQQQQQQQQQTISHGPADLQQLEVLRRTSQALMRQRNLSHCPPVTQAQLAAIHLAGSGPLAGQADQSSSLAALRQQQFGQQQRPSVPTTGGGSGGGGSGSNNNNRKTSEGCDQRGRATPTTRGPGAEAWAPTIRGQMMGQMSQQTTTGSDGSLKVGTKSLDWNDGQQAEKAHYEGAMTGNNQQQLGGHLEGSLFKGSGGSSSSSSSNKMRRLLFMTKSHQHHHIATSTSSSLHKANSASLPNNSNNLNRVVASVCSQGANKMMNSASLDNSDDTGSGGGGVSVIQSRAMAIAAAESGSASSSSLPARVQASEQDGGAPRLVAAPLRPPMITMIGAPEDDDTNPRHRSSLVEHHILIEPPSPPTQGSCGGGVGNGSGDDDDLLAREQQPVVVIVEGHQRRQRDPERHDNEGPANFRPPPAGGQSGAGFFEGGAHSTSQRALCSKETCVGHTDRRQPLAADNNKSQHDVTTTRRQHGLHNQRDGATTKRSDGCQDMATMATDSGQPEPSSSDKRDMDALQNRGLNYNGAHPAMMISCEQQQQAGDRNKPTTTTTRLAGPSMEMQPEICLEAPADDDDDDMGDNISLVAGGSGSSRRSSMASPSPDGRRPAASNEPFAKLASYGSGHQAAGIRRKLGAARSSIHGSPAAPMGDTSGRSASQLSHCSCSGSIGHQSFHGGGGPPVSTQPESEHHLCSLGSCGTPQPSGEWLALGGSDELVAAATGSPLLPPHYHQHSHPHHHRHQPSYPGSEFGEYADHGGQFAGSPMAGAYYPSQLMQQAEQTLRPRMSSVFVASPYSRAHLDSFAMLRALSQKKSKSAEDVAYLSSLVLQIWVKDRNPLLQSVSQQQLSNSGGRKNSRSSASQERQASSASTGTGSATPSSQITKRQRPKSSLTVAHI